MTRRKALAVLTAVLTLAAALAVSACGKREQTSGDPQTRPGHADARLPAQPRPRRHLHGAGARRVPQGRTGREDRDAVGPGRAAEAARGRARRHRDLLRAGDPAGARPQPRGAEHRRARAASADVADGGQGALGRSQAARRQAGRDRRDPLPGGLSRPDPAERRRRSRDGQARQRRVQPRPGDAVRQGRGDARRVLERRGRAAAPREAQAVDRAGRHARGPAPTTS